MVLKGLSVLVALTFSHAAYSAEPNACTRQMISEVNFPGLTHIEEKSDGSNGGQWFRDASGKRWYLKEDVVHEELQTSAEIMGALIYRHFGYETPEMKKIVINGRNYVAVADIGSDTEATRFDDMNSSSVRRMRVVAAFLADYDRLGQKRNNRSRPDGSFTLLDFGGAFGSKARGQHKPGEPFSAAIGVFRGDENIFEIMESVPLRFFSKDLTTNKLITKPIKPDHPWRKLSEQDAQFVVEQMKELTDARIRSIVSAAAYSQESDREYMIQTLIQRRNTIIADLVKVYLPNLENGEVSLEKRYRTVDAMQVQASPNLSAEDKIKIYRVQAEHNVSTYSKTPIWGKLGQLNIDPALRIELFLTALRKESGAIYGLWNFPKEQITDEFIQTIYATLRGSNFMTGHFLSSQEGDEHEAEVLGGLIGELRHHGLQYVAVDRDGTKLIEAIPGNSPLKPYQVEFPRSRWDTSQSSELPNPFDISWRIRRGKVQLKALAPLR